MRPNIKLSLYKLVVLKLLALLNNVIEKLTDNAAVFTTPLVTVLAMKTLRDNFSKAITDATDGSTNARKVRDISSWRSVKCCAPRRTMCAVCAMAMRRC